MLNPRLKRALVHHLKRGARAVGERSLAIVMGAGVAASCGGTTAPSDASTDQKNDAPDSQIIVEAPNFDAAPGNDASDSGDSGVIVEAPNFDSGAG
jgi:hypothetical protein